MAPMAYPAWVFWLLPLLVGLHLNFWMWHEADIVLGFPVNLLYHVALCLFLAILMLSVVNRAWPRYLDDD